MRHITMGAASGAMALLMTMLVHAQAPSPTQVQRPAPASGATSADQTVTVTGCVQKETDYRKATDAGRGGVAGTGVGAGNEFVLTNASMANATTAGANAAFELTGPNEGQASPHVGKRVEIVGKLKGGETSAAGPTGGPTAGAPPRGVDVTSKDLKLRELEITSIKTTTGNCPA